MGIPELGFQRHVGIPRFSPQNPCIFLLRNDDPNISVPLSEKVLEKLLYVSLVRKKYLEGNVFRLNRKAMSISNLLTSQGVKSNI